MTYPQDFDTAAAAVVAVVRSMPQLGGTTLLAGSNIASYQNLQGECKPHFPLHQCQRKIAAEISGRSCWQILSQARALYISHVIKMLTCAEVSTSSLLLSMISTSLKGCKNQERTEERVLCHTRLTWGQIMLDMARHRLQPRHAEGLGGRIQLRRRGPGQRLRRQGRHEELIMRIQSR